MLIARTHGSMNYCTFGCHLDIADEILQIQRTARDERSDHSTTMMMIFDCWKRKVIHRTWKKVLAALTEVGYDVLAREIGNELISRNERNTAS